MVWFALLNVEDASIDCNHQLETSWYCCLQMRRTLILYNHVYYYIRIHSAMCTY